MLWCVYHKTLEMRVVDKDGFDNYIASGEWFDHPSKVNNEVKNERQIRRRKRRGLSIDEESNGSLGI